MAALGGTEVLPIEDGTLFSTLRENFVHPATTYYDWGTHGLPWYEYLFGQTVPTDGQIWPNGVA